MKLLKRQAGFSLTEVLMALGILAVGMIFIAGVFPIAIYYVTVVAERTTGAVIADEAFAKIRIIANDPKVDVNTHDFIDMNSFDYTVNYKRLGLPDVNNYLNNSDPNMRREFAYPSDNTISLEKKQYYWSAICRSVGNGYVQATVFVCRKMGQSMTYRSRSRPVVGGGLYPDPLSVRNRPSAVYVPVSFVASNNFTTLRIDSYGNLPDEKDFVNEGDIIVNNLTGRMFRVLEKSKDQNKTIVIDKPWDYYDKTGHTPMGAWVVPPPVGGGRNPCIGVYQRIIRLRP